MERTYFAIDLKSFYASVEAVDGGYDPLSTHLVVADSSRTDKTICLAISPSLKAYGLPGRARLFEVKQAVREINAKRRQKAPGGVFKGKSTDANALSKDPSLELDFVIAPPRMARYLEVSSTIYSIYLKTIAQEDIHVYSIDEVFMDVTSYLKPLGLTPRELARRLISEVYAQTGITATGGIGTNLYLAKVAMDIVAKHIPADCDGVRIASLNEKEYREQLWDHQPLKDFWRVGPGTVNRLAALGLFTMGDICRQSLVDEDVLYSAFGINAELLIDHAWGYEPTTIQDIHSYEPDHHILNSGQVLSSPYGYQKGLLVVKEMADSLGLDLVKKGLVCEQIGLVLGFDREVDESYQGAFEADRYGRKVPKSVHGAASLGGFTSSSQKLREAIERIYRRIMNPNLRVRRVNITLSPVCTLEEAKRFSPDHEQLSLFEDISKHLEKEKKEAEKENKEHALQKAVLQIKEKYGKNAVLKGMNLEEGATMKQRNEQIGGHKA